MRTRLDEIVEEEIRAEAGDRHAGPMVAAICKRIAERAFRHGVEQAGTGMHEACKVRYSGIHFDLRGVQPAPAEERHPEQDTVHAAQAERYKPAPAEEKVPVRCPTCGGLPHPYPPSLDRRKGERRVQLNGTYWVATGGNRRCCDRRKP